MNTIRGVAAVTFSSPPARRALLGVLLGCSAAVYALRRSGNLWLLALICGLFLEQAYFLHDWFLDLVAGLTLKSQMKHYNIHIYRYQIVHKSKLLKRSLRGFGSFRPRSLAVRQM